MTLVCSVSPCYIQYYKQHNETSRTIFCTAPKDHCCSSAWNQACGALLFYLQYKTLPSMDAHCPVSTMLAPLQLLEVGHSGWLAVVNSIASKHYSGSDNRTCHRCNYFAELATTGGYKRGGAVKKGAATTQALHSSKLNSIKLKLRCTASGSLGFLLFQLYCQ